MRFLNRFVHESVALHVMEGLTELGWTTAPAPFGATPVERRDLEPEEVERIEGNLVSFALEDEDKDILAELGGPLHMVEMEMAVDVWCERPSIALALSSDVKRLLRDAFIRIRNLDEDPVTLRDDYIEPVVVTIRKPSGHVQGLDFKKKWRIVHFFARVYFEDQEIVGG